MTAASEPKEQLHIRIASALFEIEAADPSRRSRMVLWLVCVLCGLLLVWAGLAKLDIVAVAQGRLVPQTYVKIVQPAEAGIVREILVKEGAVVERGQVLARLDPTVNVADSHAVERELALQKLQLRRIEAELQGAAMSRREGDEPLLFAQVEAQRSSRAQSYVAELEEERAAGERSAKDLTAAREVLKKLEATLPSYRKTAAAYEQLASKNLVGAIQAEERTREAVEKERDLEAQRAAVEALEATLRQHDKRMAQLKSTYASELNQERLAMVSELTRLEQQQRKLTFQGGLLELKAPQAGIVNELATTTLGAVVQPGTVLLSLVPHGEPLLAEVLIENKDIGFVALDQPVRVKLAAYQFQRYGMLEGTVCAVSADSSSTNPEAQSGQQGPMGFKALIELQHQRLTTGGRDLPLAAGMQLTAEIVQGKRTVLEYLLSPVQRITSEAGRER